MKKIKISAVSYTNTKPFVFGFDHYTRFLDSVDLTYDVPSVCAQKLIDNEVDIGLVPVAALLDIPNYQIISDYCLGANGKVNSVYIFSNTKPIEEIKSLKLDWHYRSSNNLAKVLLKYHWKIEIDYQEDGPADAFVEIGDKTFGKAKSYKYVYDLSEEWMKFTGLPFVFAVWAANKLISEPDIAYFNAVLKYGLDNRETLLREMPLSSDIDLREYLMNNIDYYLDEAKLKALNLFHQYMRSL